MMFSKYKKSPGASVPPLTEVANTPSTVEEPPAPKAEAPAPKVARKPAAGNQAVAAAPDSNDDKERKRRKRLDELKTEMHHRLLDNLNLSALEGAKEAELRSEITAITSEQLAELGVVLNREDRQTLNVELFDEVTGPRPA